MTTASNAIHEYHIYQHISSLSSSDSQVPHLCSNLEPFARHSSFC